KTRRETPARRAAAGPRALLGAVPDCGGRFRRDWCAVEDRGSERVRRRIRSRFAGPDLRQRGGRQSRWPHWTCPGERSQALFTPREGGWALATQKRREYSMRKNARPDHLPKKGRAHASEDAFFKISSASQNRMPEANRLSPLLVGRKPP